MQINEPNDIERKPMFESDNMFMGRPEYIDLTTGMDLGFNNVFYQSVYLKMDYNSGPFYLIGELIFKNDQKYAPAAVMVPSGDIGGFYFLLLEGGFVYNSSPFQFAAGRFKNYDETNSPYSLFLNSIGIPANTLKFRWETNFIFYQTQWIELNWGNSASSPAWNEYHRRLQKNREFLESSGYEPSYVKGLTNYGFPDRGLNLKYYGLKVNDWRFGFIDASVYSGKPFDLE